MAAGAAVAFRAGELFFGETSFSAGIVRLTPLGSQEQLRKMSYHSRDSTLSYSQQRRGTWSHHLAREDGTTSSKANLPSRVLFAVLIER